MATVHTTARGTEPYDKVYCLGYQVHHEDWSPYPRINKLRQTFLDRGYDVDVERLRLVTESYQQHEHLPEKLKVAYAFENVLLHCGIEIYDDDLIVGEIASPVKSAPIYPEFSVNWILDEVQNHPFEEREHDQFYIRNEKEKQEILDLCSWWKGRTLDDYINLKSRVETRMKITVMTSTGDDDLINPEEKGDLEYRKAQLKRLQEEVVDIEDMSDGISIMDLGLNEFRLDLLDYIKHNGDLDKKPRGLHAVVPATDELPEGVIFVLKNINNSVNVDNRNRIHPFYMVYIGMDGQIICDYLNPKKMLDDIRLLCRGKTEPIKEVYERFNRETDDGKDMAEMSELLSEAIDSIIDIKEESDIDSLFSAGGTTALLSQVSGLDDFELICFLVVK